MYVTMVKKRLLSGAACKKCVEAEELLRNRGLWGSIDRVVWAVEGEPASEGMQLAQRYGVATAPFFIVADGQGTGLDQGDDQAQAKVQIVESTLKLMRSLSAGATSNVAIGPARVSASEASPVPQSIAASQTSVPVSHGNGLGAGSTARIDELAGSTVRLDGGARVKAAQVDGHAESTDRVNGHVEVSVRLDGHAARLERCEAEALLAELSGTSAAAPEPQEVLRVLLSRFGARAAIAFSGAEDVVLVHMAAHTGLPFSVFCLDTGRLHAETYRFIDRVRSNYGIDIALYSPQAEPLQAFVRKKGLFSFYEDGHAECCGVRKVEPLRRALAHAGVWITGQRRDQSPDTRAGVPVLQIDEANSDPAHKRVLLKSNPLSNWSSERVWRFIREHGVPYNTLHERGFISVGCEPCTRPVLPGQHEREGRWWWEQATQKECGLHTHAR